MNPLVFPRASAFDALVIIPTVANSTVLLPSFDRLIQNLDGLRVHIVASVNPLDEAQAEASIAGLRYLWERVKPEGSALTIYRHPGPCGFGGAINRGLRAACDLLDGDEGEIVHSTAKAVDEGIPEEGLVVIFNDDLRVVEGWLASLLASLSTSKVVLPSEVPNEDGTRPVRSVQGYGRIGIVGPVSNNASGIQVVGQDAREAMDKLGLDAFAADWRASNLDADGDPLVYTATFLSGFCQGYHPDLVDGLAISDDEGRPCLFDERYEIAGYEDNDLCARADRAGWRAAVDMSNFIGHLGHQTFDDAFPEMNRGMRNRLTYYDIWRERGERAERVVAVYRVRLDVPNDVNLFRMSLAGAGRLVDGVVILLTGDLARMKDSDEWRAGQVPSDARALAEAGDEVVALRRWAIEWSGKMDGSRKPDVYVERWSGEFNERHERNHALYLARTKLSADWLLSVDHDEAIESRVTREHIERLLRHPDPLVSSWDFAWINHWANNRWQNLTPPWGDGGNFLGGMHGYRLVRVNRDAPRSIQAGGTNGLHCGNVPMTGPTTKRISGIRFRHFGYMRVQDRSRKLARYNVQDPTPNPVLVGGTSYAHITHEENQLMSAFSPVNGIGVHALMYEGESADDLGRQLDKLYGLADRIVLVWTGAWSDADRRKLYGEPVKREEANLRGTLRPVVDLWEIDPEDWPETGPGIEVAKMAEHFGAEWVAESFAEVEDPSLARCRNAAIDALHGTTGMGWGYFLDPDEHGPVNYEIPLRRMAEVTDAWGWLFQFRNVYDDGRHNVSESVRMHRLDERGVMRLNGRVHESFDKAVRFLVDEGYGSVIRKAPEVMTFVNTGLSGEPEAMQDKLDRYRRLTEAELRHDPRNPGAWVTLGLYWSNEGFGVVAMECFGRAMACADRQFLPFQEAGLEYLRMARACYVEAASRMGVHPNRRVAESIVDFLDSAAPSLPRLGLPGRQGLSEEEALASLPPSAA